MSSGLLEGPISLDLIPSTYPLSRRFGIQQGAKIRCIDDFSMSSVNACVQSCESPKPHTLDVFAAMCAHVMSVMDGSTLWKGRTFDLTGAYRQCAVHPESYQHSHIMVVEPATGKLVAFRMKALPFGAVKSVHSFLRVSHSLWFILVKEFLVLTTNYFDDFVTLGTSDEASALKSCVHLVFKMLGWFFAESGSKAPDFSEEFPALGVLINVSKMGRGLVQFGNTETRRKELLETISKVLAEGRMTKVTALKLRGRLQFASANIFGRIARAALHAVTAHAYASKDSKLTDDAGLALRLHFRLLTEGLPRQLRAAERECWFLQTDASFDRDEHGDVAGVGAVLFSPTGCPIAFFSERLEADVLANLDPGNAKKTLIFECEFLALFAAFWKLTQNVRGALVIYTDNNGVRDAMISCSTRNLVARQILVATLALENEFSLWPWYNRIPTDSNCADAPSRFQVAKLVSAGAKRIDINMSTCWNCVRSLNVKRGEEQASRISHV